MDCNGSHIGAGLSALQYEHEDKPYLFEIRPGACAR